MSISPPPMQEPVVDQGGNITIPWAIFTDNLFNGDTGRDWTPNFVGLSRSGTPTISGRYYRISNSLVFYRITVVPKTHTTSTAGSTYVNNFPLAPIADGACIAVSGNLGALPGMHNSNNNRIYTPAWSSVTVPVTVIGMIEAR